MNPHCLHSRSWVVEALGHALLESVREFVGEVALTRPSSANSFLWCLLLPWTWGFSLCQD
jgi:hypothetical protein